jgi:hypothetical protein
MAEHEILLPGWSQAVVSLDDFSISAADTNGKGLYQECALGNLWFRTLFESR